MSVDPKNIGLLPRILKGKWASKTLDVSQGMERTSAECVVKR